MDEVLDTVSDVQEAADARPLPNPASGRVVFEHVSFHYGSSSDGLVLEDCLLYTSDAADERSSVDLGGRRIIKKKTKNKQVRQVM